MKNSVDLHSHTVPNDVIRELGISVEERDAEYLLRFENKIIGPTPRGLFDISARKKDLDRLGIARQILSPTHHLFMYDSEPKTAQRISRIHNESIARICKIDSDRFIGNGMLPLQDTKLAIEEIEYCHSKLELKGFEIGTNINGENLDSERLTPIYDRISSLGIPILVHPTDVLAKNRMAKYYLSMVAGVLFETTVAASSVVFGGVLKRFPKLRFVFCHGGGVIPYQLGRFVRATKVRAEIDADIKNHVENYFKQLYFDTVVFDGRSIRFLVDTIGLSKVVFGTDYPFNVGTWNVNNFEGSSLSQDETDHIMSDNVKQLYNYA